MRVYTGRRIVSGGVINPDDFNEENSALASAVNRNLDTHNLPTAAITDAKFVDRDDINSGYSTGPFFDYWSQYDQDASFLVPLLTTSLRTGTLTGTWNSLYNQGVTDAQMSIDAEPGLLRGEMIVGFERRFGYAGAPGLQTTREGNYSWVDWGLFIDDQLVAQTGKIYPRRYTVCLPWFYYTPGGTHVLDIRFRHRTTAMTSTNDEYAQNLDVYSVGHMVQLRKR